MVFHAPHVPAPAAVTVLKQKPKTNGILYMHSSMLYFGYLLQIFYTAKERSCGTGGGAIKEFLVTAHKNSTEP
ncbi:MAG: hypothetical protein O7D30_11140 [Rickettsia endosymbiont of Ixodes persulcatus]|nr:hypothetical protein [Rickettsia endosymbiont of Ixodes persulcatus]